MLLMKSFCSPLACRARKTGRHFSTKISTIRTSQPFIDQKNYLNSHVCTNLRGGKIGSPQRERRGFLSDTSYPALAQLLRRRGVLDRGTNHKQMHELFRRMVFNILIDNTDDHEKNHVLLVADRQNYQLSPAFDVLPTEQALGYQSMGVGADGAVSSIDNALSMCTAYWLSRQEAVTEARRVATVVSTWRVHFKAAGVARSAIDALTGQIDRLWLQEQRTALGV